MLFQVIVQGNLSVRHELNGINFNQLMQDIVFTNKFEYIEGLVTFNDTINTGILVLDGDFNARYILGIDLESWKENALFIDRGLIPGMDLFPFFYRALVHRIAIY